MVISACKEPPVIKGAFLLESKHPIYWEVNFVYILNNLPAANDTENVNEVRRCQLLANGRAKL